MSRKTVIVYGPQGCGKTRNSEKMRRAFGLDTVIDDWQPGSNGQPRIPKTGALVLTCDPAVHRIAGGGIAVIDFEAAMRFVHRRRRQRLH